MRSLACHRTTVLGRRSSTPLSHPTSSWCQ
ncbi:hypothetical protein NXF25_019114 [Crotalus adamanteus]|uniref:Uncharacterized protein n=1 Tax=Crotalus adamanteus TaxID=8729 RepID=A0AAW1B180_CROAD